MDTWLAPFASMPVDRAAALLFALNAALFAACILGGKLFVRAFPNRRCAPEAPPIEKREIALGVVCVALNGAVSVAGFVLWRSGVITVRESSPLRSALDIAVLVVAMDLAMYVLHRAAHWAPVYRFVHAIHHRYDRPRPLTLFVLHPLEVLGFGTLWLVVLTLYSATWTGIVVYLGINALAGTMGHLGVEPLPARIARWRIVEHLGTSTFHAEHHLDARHNFGFYTDLWDRLFGTKKPAP